jgi:hypothetical protein
MAGIRDFFKNKVGGGIKDFFNKPVGESVDIDGVQYEIPVGKTAEQVKKEVESGDLDPSKLTKAQTRGQKIKEGLEDYGSVESGQIGMSSPLTPGALGQPVMGGYQPLLAQGGLASFQGGGYADYYNTTNYSPYYQASGRGTSSAGRSPRGSVSIPSKVGGQSEIYRYLPSEVEVLYTQQAADRAREMGLGAPSGSVLTAADPLSIEWNMAPQMMTGMEYGNYPSDYGYEDSYYDYGGGYGGGGGIADLFASFMQNRPSREGRRRQRKEEKQATKDDDQRRQLLQMIGSIYGAPQDITEMPPVISPPGGGYDDDYDYGGIDDYEDISGGGYVPGEYERAEGSPPTGETHYPRMNGAISGPGTETSDDIPAMLSDGEFVTNAEALRGIGLLAGADKNNKEEQRLVGARKMYEQQREAQKFAEDLLE